MKNRVKEYRLKEGLTQEELSAKSEVSRSTISGLENGSLEVITNVTISKNPVNTKETFKISVAVKETVTEPTMYRLPFKLGQKKGGIK